MALLDEDGDGVIVSSLHTRQATRVYVRPVSGGIAERALSDEEQEALTQATSARGGLATGLTDGASLAGTARREDRRMTSPRALPRADRAPAPAGAPIDLDVVAGLLHGLDRQQRQAVTHGDGPLLVLAGPGAGKTHVVTRRIAWLIATKRARPEQILALTFTERAAEEMQARVDVLVPYGQAGTDILTFHAFGDRLIRDHALELGLPGEPRVVSRTEAAILLGGAIERLALRPLPAAGRPDAPRRGPGRPGDAGQGRGRATGRLQGPRDGPRSRRADLRPRRLTQQMRGTPATSRPRGCASWPPPTRPTRGCCSRPAPSTTATSCRWRSASCASILRSAPSLARAIATSWSTSSRTRIQPSWTCSTWSARGRGT